MFGDIINDEALHCMVICDLFIRCIDKHFCALINKMCLTSKLQLLFCNTNQLDALFILNLFRQTTSTCFGCIYCPSSGGVHCIYTAIGTYYTFT
jgi:hypothetical protein